MSLYKTRINPATGKLQLVPSGTILVFKAGVANFASLPASGNTPNDARITNDNGHLYVWDGLAWNDQGDIFDIDWSALTGKPTSTVADIDDAVAKRHTQNTDTKLDEGGANEVTAAEIRNAIDNPSAPSAIDVPTTTSGVSVQDALDTLNIDKADKVAGFISVSETILLLHGNGTSLELINDKA